MSRHQEIGRSFCGCRVLVVPVKRVTASLATVVPSWIVPVRARATVWTRPVGLFVHW